MAHHDSLPGLLVFVTLLATGSPHAAGWMPDGNPLAVAPRNQTGVVATADGIGGAFVVWRDSRNSSGAGHSFDIYAQHIDANGYPLWAENGIPVCTLPGSDSSPQVIPDGVGGVIITWARTSGAPGLYWDIFSQRLDAAGNSQWQTNGAPVIAKSGMQIAGGTIVDGTGGAITVWYDNGDLFAQKILANGSLAWGVDGVSVCSKPGRQQIPAIASDGVGGAIVAWEDTSSAVTNFDIYAQRVSAAGNRLWAPNGVPVCALPNRQRDVKIIPDPDGGAVLFWRDETTWPGADLYMQKLNQDGVGQWTTNGIPLCIAPGFKHLSSLRRSGAHLFAAWSDERTGVVDIYAQRLDWNGIAYWDENGLAITETPAGEVSMRMAVDGAGGIFVTWTDQVGVSANAFAQRIDENGQELWASGGVTISTADNAQYPNSIVAEPDGEAIVFWTDYRNGIDPDIYAQRLGPQGPTLTAVDRTPSVGMLNVLPNRPNPFGESSMIEVELDAPSNVAMEMFDVGGRRVRADRWPSRGAGWNRFEIRARDQDGRILPSGVYFLRISSGHSTVTRKIVIAR